MEPPAKKAKKNGSTDVLDDSECSVFFAMFTHYYVKICEGYIPKITSNSTGWALRVFLAWRKEHNEYAEGKYPEKLLEEPQVDLLNFCLSWKSAGKMESRTCLYLLIIFLQDYIVFLMSYVSNGVVCPNFINGKNMIYSEQSKCVIVRKKVVGQ